MSGNGQKSEQRGAEVRGHEFICAFNLFKKQSLQRLWTTSKRKPWYLNSVDQIQRLAQNSLTSRYSLLMADTESS